MNWQLKISISWLFTFVLMIFCNQTKQILACSACWSVQACINDGKREVMWNISFHVQYISSLQGNTSIWFNKLLNCSFKQNSQRPSSLPCPHQLLQGTETTSLCLFYHKSEWAISAWSSPFPCHLQQICFSLVLSCYWRSVGKFRKTCEEHWFHFQAMISTIENSIIMNRCKSFLQLFLERSQWAIVYFVSQILLSEVLIRQRCVHKNLSTVQVS